MQEVGEEEWGRAWPVLYDTLGRKPLGRDALPPLRHLADGRAAARRGRAGGRAPSAGPTRARWASPWSTSGEHYVVDLLAGAAIVVAVRRGERYVEPVAQAVSRGLAAARAHRKSEG